MVTQNLGVFVVTTGKKSGITMYNQWNVEPSLFRYKVTERLVVCYKYGILAIL